MDMDKIDVGDKEQIAALTGLWVAQKELLKQLEQAGKSDVWGGKLVRSINNAIVYAAGALVAVLVGCAAISGIVWLFVNIRNLIGG